jgi:hypothetical protein
MSIKLVLIFAILKGEQSILNHQIEINIDELPVEKVLDSNSISTVSDF